MNFIGTLGDILRGGTQDLDAAGQSPASNTSLWLAWPLSFQPERSPQQDKDDARQQRARTMRAMLAAARNTNPVPLPITEDTESDAPEGKATADASDSGYSDAAAPAKHLLLVLPWLFAGAGQLGGATAEFLASKLALSRLQVLDLSRLLGSTGEAMPWVLGDDVAWVGATALPTPTIAAAATLHRLAHRCGGPLSPLPPVGGTVVVLSHRREEVAQAAAVLALYFHLYCFMDAKDAAAAAGGALRCPPPPLSVLESGVEEMAACGQGWLQRVVLEWRYSGGRVEVTGEAVGGWERRVPLSFDVQRCKWRVQLWGLPPGPCSYKFIVDGRWCTDMNAPTDVDEYGNRNNTTSVPGCAQIGAAARAVAAADGMAASFGPDILPLEATLGGAVGSGGVVDFDDLVSPSMASQDDGLWEEAVSPEERLRLARFGAAILAYYSKSEALHRAGRI